MPECIERLSATDFEEAIDFLNLVFSQAYRPHDFVNYLPRLYHPTEESMQNHFAIRKNGRIRAVVGLFPAYLHIGPITLKAGVIGSVATHPNERKTGLMCRLMEACIEEMRSKDFQISWLGGARQRYGYYGYEKAGIMFKYNITKKNIQSCLPDTLRSGIHFEPIGENDHERLSRARYLHDAQHIRCERPPEEFFLYLTSCNMYPWAALDANGNMVGYMVANKAENEVSEVLADNSDEFLRMICRWVSDHADDGISLALPPWAGDFVRKAGSISEDVFIRGSSNWRIFDWTKVIGALLAVKSGFSRLADGEANIDIKNHGIIRILVKDGSVSCENIEGKPDLFCDELSAMRLMLGPLSPDNVMEFRHNLFPLFSSWFPLPLCWPQQDRA